MSLKNLKVGKHIITLTVLDSDGGQSDYTFTVKVVTPPGGGPGFEFVGLLGALAIAGLVIGIRRRK